MLVWVYFILNAWVWMRQKSAPCKWVRVFIHAQCLCSWLTLYVRVNAAVCWLVHHLLCRASGLVGLSHLLRSSCQTSEEIMVMFLPDPIWWPAQLTPSVGSWSSGNSHTATITQQSAELYLKVMLLAWAQEQRWIDRWLEKDKKGRKGGGGWEETLTSVWRMLLKKHS